ncbi:MAG: amylo-alpha-1,6-glucosidase [Bilophila sp.]
MRFCFDKLASQNIRKSLYKEWLETNGLGDYASSSLICCNMRKYHGLFVANLDTPPGRHVLLSTLDETLRVGERDFAFSCRKHPGVYHPRGHEYLEGVDIGEWPRFTYRIGGFQLVRELLMPQGKRQLLLRYTLLAQQDAAVSDSASAEALRKTPPVTLRLRPLLAFRSFHTLTHANLDLHVETSSVPGGFGVKPYDDMPPLFVQSSANATFFPSPDWYYSVEYLMERERGFDASEDLFQPGVLDCVMEPGVPVYVLVGTEPFAAAAEPSSKSAPRAKGKAASDETTPTPERLNALWEQEVQQRLERRTKARTGKTGASLSGRLMRYLAEEGRKFLVRTPQGTPAILAGYHWFEAWGRDSLIALPGLTFYAGREEEGVELLRAIGASARDGRIPNFFSPDGNHAYNSVDASLWYIWAVQQMLLAAPHLEPLAREVCWPVIKAITTAYSTDKVPHVRIDPSGLLQAGDASTQLTWMDASVNGVPVTPRAGYPVDINALWYNALAFTDYLARKCDEPAWKCGDRLLSLRTAFGRAFHVGGIPSYLADVCLPDGGQDTAIRPNMLLAVSLPFAVLDDDQQAGVVETVRNNLLTPYGLRTLSPGSPAYQGLYEGDSEARDSAYHQGTVWPWLLGAYGDALLRVAWDTEGAVRDLLVTLTPLFSTHLGEAGVGSISEIFDGNPPHLPGGSIAQAWSVGECLRLLQKLRQAAPAAYADWEISLGTRTNRIYRG